MTSLISELDDSLERGHAIDVSNTMEYKLRLAEPYNIFYNKIPKVMETMSAPNAILFSDLLCPTLGKLEKSLQINFVIDFNWLFEQYKIYGLEYVININKLLTVLYDKCLSKINYNQFPTMCHAVQKLQAFGCHHA